MKPREKFVEDMKNQLDAFNQRIDELEDRAETIKADAQEMYQTRMNQVRDQRDQFTAKITEVEKSTEEAWTKLKNGVEIARAGLKAGIQEAIDQYK
ncbi:MAG: hypothetical protein PVF49_00065 [Anaerolineales bacterium]|jgi:uncharacterized coiled-coil DUF342 family protein